SHIHSQSYIKQPIYKKQRTSDDTGYCDYTDRGIEDSLSLPLSLPPSLSLSLSPSLSLRLSLSLSLSPPLSLSLSLSPCCSRGPGRPSREPGPILGLAG